MVYLIGTDHRVQHNGRVSDDSLINDVNELIRKFEEYLLGKIKELNVCLIAEEFNEEALHKKWATESVARNIANKADIEHRFCDPTKSERRELGIPCKNDIILGLFGKQIKHSLTCDQKELIKKEEQKYWHIREKFWLDKIRDKLQEPLIFICGVDHIEGFKGLIIEKGFGVRIIDHDWGRELLERYFNKAKDMNFI